MVDPLLKPDRPQAGFVLLGIVLLAALVVAVTMGFARHALVAIDATEADLQTQRHANALSSGIEYARQALRADDSQNVSQRLGGGHTVSIAVTDAGASLRAITIQSGDDETTHTVQALAEVYPAVGEILPTLTETARTAVRTSPGLISVTADTTYTDIELTGIVLLAKGVDVTFHDVIVRGSIVSANALTDDPWRADEATSITITGGLLIETGSTLSGLAILGPDMTISGNGASGVQIHGVIVAEALELLGRGALHGQVVTTTEPSFGRGIDFPGAGREPRTWPTALALGSSFGRLIFPYDETSIAERDAIRNLRWPADSEAMSTPVPSESPR